MDFFVALCSTNCTCSSDLLQYPLTSTRLPDLMSVMAHGNAVRAGHVVCCSGISVETQLGVAICTSPVQGLEGPGREPFCNSPQISIHTARYIEVSETSSRSDSCLPSFGSMPLKADPMRTQFLGHVHPRSTCPFAQVVCSVSSCCIQYVHRSRTSRNPSQEFRGPSSSIVQFPEDREKCTYESTWDIMVLLGSWLKAHPESSHRQWPYIVTFLQSVSFEFSVSRPISANSLVCCSPFHPQLPAPTSSFGSRRSCWLAQLWWIESG